MQQEGEAAHMRKSKLILDRYRPLGEAGAGGFGTVQVAWDERIQRKVAIKTIQLTELDAVRAALPGANAVAPPPSAEESIPDSLFDVPALDGDGEWDGALPWDDEYAPDAFDDLDELSGPEGADAYADEAYASEFEDEMADRKSLEAYEPVSADYGAAESDYPQLEPIRSLAHLPGLDEARTAAMLQDARIVTVYDFEVRDRTAYLIMEYVEGLTLTRLLHDYSEYITLDIVAAVFEAVAGALSVAHKAGVLHLDIKPDNIMIDAKGQVKVTDFGLATLADASGQGLAGGGTIGYMPLEQMRREHLDARTDEWSLAAVLYEMLAGENPFLAPNLDEAPAAIEDAELVLPSLCWENLDEQIDDVIFYALDPDREERYANVKDFAEEARKFLGNARKGRSQLASIVTRELKGAETPSPSADLQDMPQAVGEDAEAAKAPSMRSQVQHERSERSARRRRVARDAASAAASALLTPRAISIGGRVFSAAASAFLGYLAATNIPFIADASVPFLPVAVALLAAVAVGALGLFRPGLGALAGYLLLSVALVLGNSPIAGAVVLVAVFIWWYFIGREGVAEGNVALCLPLAGAVGGNALAPLAAGASLRIGPACATAAFACVVAVVLGACGSGNLIGWDAFANWQFSKFNVDGYLLSMVRNPAVWCMVASWIASAAIQAAVGTRGSRTAELAGFALGAVILVAGCVGAAVFNPVLAVGNALPRMVLGLLVPIVIVGAGLLIYRPTE